MARYIVRRLLTMLLTMMIVSMVVFAIVEIAPGNVARNILGAYATPEQEKSMANQFGLDRPVAIRYISWLFGSDWQARAADWAAAARNRRRAGLGQQAIAQWWAVDPNGDLVQWKVEDRPTLQAGPPAGWHDA